LSGTLPVQPTEVVAVETADQVAVPGLVAVTSGETGAVVGMAAAAVVLMVAAVVADMGGHRDMVVGMEAAAAATVVVRALGTDLDPY